MLSVINFTLNSTSIRPIICKSLPYILFTHGKTTIELQKKNNIDMIASNQKILINNSEESYSQIKPNDVIACENNIFILTNSITYDIKSFCIGPIQHNKAIALLFIAPDKISGIFFTKINRIISHYRKFKQIIVSCHSVKYMDKESIKAMIALIKKSQKLSCSISFYSPSQKFNSYLTLSKVNKKVKVRLINYNENIQQTIDSKKPFALKNQLHCYTIKPNIINYVGRNANLCNIIVNNPWVSRVHSAIIMIKNAIYLVDCGSINGTFINKKRVAPFTLQALKVNDRLFFANHHSFTVVLNSNNFYF